MADLKVGFGTPFQAQIDFLRQKLRLPTERWDDIQRAAHDRAFIVAGAAKADLLADLHQAVTQAATDGRGLQAFRKDFKAIVARHGWTGWTGEGSRAGEAWRTRVIYQTNMATSYAAGRYKQMTDPEFLRLRPYWRYIHSESVLHPRPQHLAWHGLTLPAEHPFWQSHFPPNGWGCHCRVTPISRKEGEASARAGLGEPPEGWDGTDPKTGAKVGVDKGFDYAPGASVDTPLRQLVQDKLIKHPPAIAKALAADVNRYIEVLQSPADFARMALSDAKVAHSAWLGFVEDPLALSSLAGVDVTGFFVTLPGSTPRHVRNDHSFDGDGQRMAEPDDYQKLASVLNAADSLRAGHASDKGNATVVATKRINRETFRAVFEVLPGKKNRALALLSLVIKTR